jgi:hypothetical protein
LKWRTQYEEIGHFYTGHIADPPLRPVVIIDDETRDAVRLSAREATTGCSGEWLDDARAEAEHGVAELDRGEGIRGTVAELMARIDVAVRTRAAERAGR